MSVLLHLPTYDSRKKRPLSIERDLADDVLEST